VGTVRREITLPPAAPKLNVRVSPHSATQCMAVGIGTPSAVVGMSFIMAMSMQGNLVTQIVASSLAFWGDVVKFDEISWSKQKLTPSTFPLLLFQEFGYRPSEEWMISESLTPIQEVSVIWTGFTFDLGVSLDLRFGMVPDFTPFWG